MQESVESPGQWKNKQNGKKVSLGMGNESYDEINNQHMGSRFDPNHQPNLRQKQHVNGTPKTSLSSQQAQRRNKNQLNNRVSLSFPIDFIIFCI